MRNVMKWIFIFMSSFLCDFQFMIYSRFCQSFIVNWSGTFFWLILMNLIQTLTSEVKILNPKHAGSCSRIFCGRIHEHKTCGVLWPYSRTQNNARTQAFCCEVRRIVVLVFMNHFVHKEVRSICVEIFADLRQLYTSRTKHN